MARAALLIASVAIAISIAGSIAGCRVPQRIPRVVIGPFDGAPSSATFHRIVSAARAAGYEPLSSDARSGVIRVRAQASVRGEHAFTIQCFADGLVQIVPVGPLVSRDGDRFVLPAPLRTEMVTLADALTAARHAPDP